MKPTFLPALAASTLLCTTGCAINPQRPPTAIEQKFFNITTNFVTEVRWQTNSVLITNLVNEIPLVTTNWSVLVITNVSPTYDFSPNTNSAQLALTTGAVTNLAAPGFGSLATTIVSGLFGLWGLLRSRRADRAAATLAQIIETGEQVLLALPDGPALAQQWKTWMVKHQAQTGVISDVSQLVANVVDTESARRVANEIKRIISVDSLTSQGCSSFLRRGLASIFLTPTRR